MNSKPTAMKHGTPAEPVSQTPDASLSNRVYVRGTDVVRDFWRNALEIILTGVFTLYTASFFLPRTTGGDTSEDLTDKPLIPLMLLNLFWFPIIAVVLLLFLILITRRIRYNSAPNTPRKAVKLPSKRLSAAAKLAAGASSALFIWLLPDWATYITGGGFPQKIAEAIAFLLVCTAGVSAALIDARIVATDPLTRLEEDALETENTLKVLEDRFTFLQEKGRYSNPDNSGKAALEENLEDSAPQPAEAYTAWDTYRPVYGLILPILLGIGALLLIAVNSRGSSSLTAVLTLAMIGILLLSMLDYIFMVCFRVASILAKPASTYMRALSLVASFMLNSLLTVTVLRFLFAIFNSYPLIKTLENSYATYVIGIGFAILFVLFVPKWYGLTPVFRSGCF